MSLETVMAAMEAPPAASVAPLVTPTPEETTAAVPPAGDAAVLPTDQPTDGAVAETIEEQEPNLEETPDSSGDFAKYKPLFKEHPELRNIIGREQAYSSLGQFSEIRELVQRIPTLADAEQLVADSEVRRELSRTFREDIPTFVESLKNTDPLAFQKFAADLPEILKEADPQMWTAQARLYVPEVLTNLALNAQRDGDQATFDAVQLLAQKLGARLGPQQAAPQRDNSETARLRKQIEERNQADAEAQFNSFWKQTDVTVIDNTVASIEATIKKALPDATEDQLYYMVNDAYRKTLEMLNAQPQTMSQINAFRESARKGKQGTADQKAIVEFYTQRAKLVVPKASKEVIDHWSNKVLKLNTENIQKKTALAAKTRDVGTGPGATTSAAAPTQAGQGKLHGNTILEQLRNGTYVPPAQRR